MEVKNIREQDYFTAVDGSEITETFGLATNKMKEASVAFAIVKPEKKTAEHTHSFIEFYIITAGEGLMHINEEQKGVKTGDNILIPKEAKHWIENTGNENLEFYCFCVPAFTEKKTAMF